VSALKELTEEGRPAANAVGLSAEQAAQEAEYEFPYHYIPRLEGGNFSQVRKLRWGYEYLSYLRFVLARLERVEFDSLLDVGCGEGRFLREASRRFPGKRLLGIDFSARAIEYARLLNPGLDFAREDIAGGAESPERFDVVTLIETLEHVPTAESGAFVSGLRRRVRDGGMLVVTAPSMNIKLSPKHYRQDQHSGIGEQAQRRIGGGGPGHRQGPRRVECAGQEHVAVGGEDRHHRAGHPGRGRGEGESLPAVPGQQTRREAEQGGGEDQAGTRTDAGAEERDGARVAQPPGQDAGPAAHRAAGAQAEEGGAEQQRGEERGQRAEAGRSGEHGGQAAAEADRKSVV